MWPLQSPLPGVAPSTVALLTAGSLPMPATAALNLSGFAGG